MSVGTLRRLLEEEREEREPKEIERKLTLLELREEVDRLMIQAVALLAKEKFGEGGFKRIEFYLKALFEGVPNIPIFVPWNEGQGYSEDWKKKRDLLSYAFGQRPSDFLLVSAEIDLNIIIFHVYAPKPGEGNLFL